MQRKYFHNDKKLIENSNEIKSHQTYKTEVKKIVDINILLNKVKFEEKVIKKKKIVFFSFTTLGLLLFGIFIVSIK